MKVLLSPQVRDNSKVWYEIEDQKITATINDITDTFDFTDIPDGELQLYDDEGSELIETVLSEVPILSAKKEDGVLTVEILFSINADEQDERLLFPEPMTLEEFNDLMEELVERDKVEEDESVDDDIIVEDDNIIDVEEVDF